MGTSGGVSDTFTYLRFREVGCDADHMGKSRMLSSLAGAIMFWFSGSLSEVMGRENILVLSLFCVGLRFSLLQRMESPIYGYAAETIRGSIFGAFWSSSTVYASQMGGPRATMLLLLNGVYNGIGRSTGSLVGGRIQALVGTEELFRYMSYTNVLFAILMICYYNAKRRRGVSRNYLSMRSLPERTSESKKVI